MSLMSSVAAAETPRARLLAPDLLRGLVMVLMALDHTRDFFTTARFDPLDLARTTPALFLTRWVTHFCAPTFVLLAGASAYLYGRRGRTRAEVSRFLLTRGLWLVVLEVTVVRFGWFFNVDYIRTGGQVIWAIGWAMVVLAGLSYALSVRAVAAVGVGIIVGHNLLDPLTPDHFGAWGWLWTVLHEGGPINPADRHQLVEAYPLLPWIGVMCAGYGFGALLVLPDLRRRRVLLTLGLSLMAAFVALSLLNRYGDPAPWTPQRTPFLTLLAALDREKYPPSLLYLLMTLGPAIAALPLLERWPEGPPRRFFLTFGRVPLIYYLLHLPLIHALALVAALVTGFDPGFLFVSAKPGSMLPPGWGVGLPGLYAVWAGVVLMLYPVCRWFAGVKARSGAWWWSYL